MPHQTTLAPEDLRQILQQSAGVSDGIDIDGDIFDTDFQDLGYDSIAIMEVVARITSEYGLAVDDGAAMAAKTPRGLLELVNRTG